MLGAMLEIEPSWAETAEVVFTDDKLSHESITQVLPNVTTFLCWWHLVYRDLENVRNCGRLAEKHQIKDFILAEFVYGINEASIESKWQEFQVGSPLHNFDVNVYFLCHVYDPRFSSILACISCESCAIHGTLDAQ
jgi:hypothetical protein